MTRAWLWTVLLVSACQLCPACAGCNPDPVNPGTGGTGGYWPTPPVTGGAAPTGGAPATGGTAGTGGGELTEAERVCQHLDDIGCAQGARLDCAAIIETYLTDERFGIDTNCLMAADTVAQARACDSVACEGGAQ